ncbi:hypothetical protein HELRODRAFT_74987 [Helobdella robusta]|uniref:G-protein coupled receptors family 1 profile domain-containing protein n=1 Tax=Helobdella robusta TaxID=6412 RepID=T1G1Z1_HELRO|nr:hypothetical protein HELRODRAFT_74987 [Helobdella robusta]ESO08546.1 hypothetical protein HELRODRAFT_74987 [Helobdella robusta]
MSLSFISTSTSSSPSPTSPLSPTSSPTSPPSQLVRFNKWYQNIHGYLSIIVCIFGISSNIINILVLTRPKMTTPTNTLLTVIACYDFMTMVSYLPYAIYFYCYSSLEGGLGHSKSWIIFLIFHNKFVIICHTSAMWTTVLLAVLRFFVVTNPKWNLTNQVPFFLFLFVVSVFCATVLTCMPMYFMHKLVDLDIQHNLNSSRSWIGNENITAGQTKQRKFGYWLKENDALPDKILLLNFWLFGVLLKLAPCLLLSILSLLLIRSMRQANFKRKKLKQRQFWLNNTKSSHRNEAMLRKGVDCNRTTAMLVAVVLTFVVTELPPGIISLLSTFDYRIFEDIYVQLGDVWDILVLINSAVNFVLYCTMSRLYRRTICEMITFIKNKISNYFSGLCKC